MFDTNFDKFLKIDEQFDKNRQRSLNIHNLSFDPNRPIYQHFFRLAHFFGENRNEELFEELVKGLQELYPNENVKASINQYLQNQKQIDQLRQGYLNQLEEEQVKKSIEGLKDQINKISGQIQQTNAKIYKEQQITEALNAEVSEFGNFLKENESILEKMHQEGENMCELQKQHEQAQQNFENKRKKLEVDTKSHLNQFESQYIRTLNEKKHLEDAIKNLKQEKSILQKYKTDYESIKKLSIQIQNEVEQIQNQLKFQRQKNQELQEMRNKRKSQQEVEEYQYLQKQIGKLSSSSQPSQLSQITETTQYLSLKKTDDLKSRYPLWYNGLVLNSVMLAVLTGLKLMGVF